MYDKALDLLAAMGIAAEDAEDYIKLCAEEVEEYVKSFCGIAEIPDSLTLCCARMICGRVIKKMLCDGSLDNYDFAGAVESVKEGDVTVAFDSGADSRSIFISIADDMADGMDMLVNFRKIKW